MKSSKGMKVVMHEVHDDQHRIVVFKEDGTNDTGEWVELRQIAHLDGYFAITGPSALPQGVFTCREIPFQQLG